MKVKGMVKVAEARPYTYDDRCFVELWDISKANFDEDTVKEVVTKIATLSHGNEEPRDVDKLFRLLIERGHESVFEFVRDSMFGIGIKDSLRNKDFPPIKYYAPQEEWIKIFEKNEESFALFRIKAPIFVLRQLMRARKGSYNELSRRYTKNEKVPFEFWYFEGWEKFEFDTPYGKLTLQEFYDLAESIYNSLIKQGIKPQVARSVLPVSLYSTVWVLMDYKALFNLFVYRLSEEAQEETRLIVKKMFELLLKYRAGLVRKMIHYAPFWCREGNPLFRIAREKRCNEFLERADEIVQEIEEEGEK